MGASLRRAEAGGSPNPAPWLFEGLADFSGARFFCDAKDDSPLFLRRRSQAKLRVVNFIALSGSAGLWGPAAINATLLAASEINRRGGILGREVEVVFRDAGGDLDDIVRTASEIVDNDDADVIIGSHISAVRVALRKVAKGRVPYIYTPVYEGGERTPGVIAIGETPCRQSKPAIQWLADFKRARRWYLIGSDYVWPWLSHRAIKRYIKASGGRVVGEEFVPMGQHDHEAHIARIKAAKPDVVMISLIGTNSISFNRAFAEHGLAARMLRFCGAMDETVLLGIGADNTENLFCSSGYFADFASRDNDTFRASYQAAFGRCAPPVGSVAESNYEGLKFLETVAARAGSVELRPLMAAAQNVNYRAARGDVAMTDGVARMPIYLAEATGLDFRLVREF
ncbi:MAG: substrate-binding domain-containing protein [Xanthobacteraceae bacterium]|nr:substrate-binding domain-containing protein [Xanthobacteraceae bacterium]